MMAETNAFYCQYCDFLSHSWRELLKHTFQAHSALPGFRQSCPVQGCLQSFSNYSSMLSHLSRHHGGLSNISDDTVSHETPISAHETGSSNDEIVGDGDVDVNNLQREYYFTDSPHSRDDVTHNKDANTAITAAATDHSRCQFTSEKAAALFLLNLKERHRVTQEGIDFTVDQVQNMVSGILDDVKESIICRVGNDDAQLIADINDTFDSHQPFRNLKTKYMQQLFYKNHFNLIVS